MLCMFFFTITVVIKKFSIPCPLPLPNELKANQTGFPFSSTLEIEENQTCTAEAATINARVSSSTYGYRKEFYSWRKNAFTQSKIILPFQPNSRVLQEKCSDYFLNCRTFSKTKFYICVFWSVSPSINQLLSSRERKISYGKYLIVTRFATKSNKIVVSDCRDQINVIACPSFKILCKKTYVSMYLYIYIGKSSSWKFCSIKLGLYSRNVFPAEF